jgi:hypothetical protein
LIFADNKTASSWTRKGCKRSERGRALGRIFCALLINSPVGIDTEYISTKDNIISDLISRVDYESDITLSFAALMQNYPCLGTCRRFHPSPELLSAIMGCLLYKKLTDPLTLRVLVQSNPGKITT